MQLTSTKEAEMATETGQHPGTGTGWTYLEAIVFHLVASAGRVLRVVGHPRQLRTAAIHEDVLTP